MTPRLSKTGPIRTRLQTPGPCSGVFDSGDAGRAGAGTAEREKVEARRGTLSPRLMKLYDGAQTFRDGKWLKIGISSTDDLREVTELLMLKRPPKAGA